MANTKISQLPAATTLTTGDLLPVVQGGATKQVTLDLLPISTAAAAALAGKDAAGAAAAAQAAAIQRANHTGTQTADTITDGTTNKAYTAVEKTKLAGIAAGATVNRADTATDAAITAAVNGLINGAPGALDTLKELADAMADDAAFSATVTNALALKAPLASPAFTGTPTGITKTHVGLGNVDNTADTAKPVSTAQATAINSRLAAASNLADLANITTARTNLGLGTAATQPSTAFDAAGTAAAVTYPGLNGKPGPTGHVGPKRVIRLGLFPESANPASETQFSAAAGEMPTTVLVPYSYLDQPDTTKLNALHARGQTAVIAWMPCGASQAPAQPTYSLANIIAGNFDAYMTTFFTALKGLNFTVYMRWAHEMNGNWYPWSEQVNGNTPGQFASAWQHVYNLAQTVGATNVKWIFCPTTEYGTPGQAGGSTLLSGLYPGDAYVDVLGLNGYNFGATGAGGWRDPATVYNATVASLNALNGSKPIWICEMGCADDDGGSKAAWFTQFFTWLLTTRISEFLYYNSADTGKNWRVDSTTANAAAFTAGMASLRENSQASGYQLVAGTGTTVTADPLNRTLTITATGGSGGGLTAAKASGLALVLGS